MQVAGITNVKKICCGGEFSMALTNDNKLYVWGRNNYGQLGVAGKLQNKEASPRLIRQELHSDR